MAPVEKQRQTRILCGFFSLQERKGAKNGHFLLSGCWNCPFWRFPHERWHRLRLWQDILAAAADGMSRRGRRRPCVCHNLLKEISE
jgi:hypothetical protein